MLVLLISSLLFNKEMLSALRQALIMDSNINLTLCQLSFITFRIYSAFYFKIYDTLSKMSFQRSFDATALRAKPSGLLNTSKLSLEANVHSASLDDKTKTSS